MLDGSLMANSLHYVEDQAGFVRACESHMKQRKHFLIVEYDTTRANPWVPYPVNQRTLPALFDGYSSIRLLHLRPSIHRRDSLYSVAIVG